MKKKTERTEKQDWSNSNIYKPTLMPEWDYISSQGEDPGVMHYFPSQFLTVMASSSDGELKFKTCRAN